METYLFETLISFFQRQKEVEYEAIETVLAILKNDGLYPEDKKDAILYMLRRAGLNETTHKDRRFLPLGEDEQGVPKEIAELNHMKYNECLMTQMISVELANGGIMFEICLN